jgi:hypothetical protein
MRLQSSTLLLDDVREFVCKKLLVAYAARCPAGESDIISYGVCGSAKSGGGLGRILTIVNTDLAEVMSETFLHLSSRVGLKRAPGPAQRVPHETGDG